MQDTIVTNNSQETLALGEKIAREVKDGGIVCLYGELGSGKTTFTQGIAKALGIGQYVNSPSFLIMRTYELPAKNEERQPNADRPLDEKLTGFYHVDLYRLESEREIEDIGLPEILEDSRSIVVIEWAEKLGNLLPQKRIDLHFQYIDEEKRKITLKSKQ